MLDGRCLPGSRLFDMDACAMLNFVYSGLVDGLDMEGKFKLDMALLGKRSAGGGWVIDDPDLPESMQGMEAPSWWNPHEDSFSMTALRNVELA